MHPSIPPYRRRIIFRWVLSCLVFAGLTACQVGWGPFSDADTSPHSLGVVLFQDDFSDPTSGWDRVRDQDGTLDYEDGSYLFSILRPAWYYWATPNLNFSDVRIEVQAMVRTPASLNAYGVICRYQDPGNFYFFTVTSDGFFAVSKFENGQESLLGNEMMGSSPAIVQGLGTNHLGVECLGDRLSFFVNGSSLIEVRDSSFSTGDVGLITTLLEGSASEIWFDNFSVLAP